jgi:hypothetical protein
MLKNAAQKFKLRNFFDWSKVQGDRKTVCLIILCNSAGQKQAFKQPKLAFEKQK